ncbi:hypothetical protein KUC90_30935 [Pseudomonas aeruginosa]|nr:hypothetical protein [Pseudomonas aeruginosa]
MVAHDGQRVARLDHATSDLDGFNLLGAAINEVAEENHLALNMLPGAFPLLIPQFA